MELKTKYAFICPVCGVLHEAKPSLMMLLGTNSGHGNCPTCKEFLHFKLTDDGEMQAEEWEAYVDRVRVTNEDIKYFEELINQA